MVEQNLKNRYKIIILKLSCILLFICFFVFSLYIKIKKNHENIEKSNFKQSIKYEPDDLTLVTAYYKIKSKHSFPEYLRRLKSFVKLNRSIVFFTSKTFINIIKKMRPNNLQNKTIF